MSKTVVITKHAKRRFAERLELSKRNEYTLQFRKALLYGISPSNFTGAFYDYLSKKLYKNRGSKIKIYCNYVYIHKGKKLITMYKVPDKYLPVKNYLPSNTIKCNNVVEKIIDAELLLRDYYKFNDFKFYYKKNNKNLYTVVLIIKDELTSIEKGKDLDKIKIACVKKHFNELGLEKGDDLDEDIKNT